MSSLTGEGESGRAGGVRSPASGVTKAVLQPYPRAGPRQLKPALGGNYKKSGIRMNLPVSAML